MKKKAKVLIFMLCCLFWGNHVLAKEFTVPEKDYKVSDTDVTKYPYSSIVYFSKTLANGRLSRATGVVVGRDYVLTAAHVNNGWVSAKVIPALTSTNKYPFGSWALDREKSISCPTFVPGYPGDDYALAKVLPRKGPNNEEIHIGDVVKPLTILPDSKDNTIFIGSELATLGYPSFTGRTQYFAHFRVTRFYGNYRIEGKINSSGGNSGAPLLNEAAQVLGTYHGGSGVSAMNSSKKMPDLLKWGLSKETSRIYFVKDKEEWETKRKQINPTGNYIETNNGQTISATEFFKVANQEVIKEGYYVTKFSDGVNSYSTEKNQMMPIGGLTLYPQEFKLDPTFTRNRGMTDLKLGFKDDSILNPIENKIVLTKVPETFDFGNDHAVSTTQKTLRTKEAVKQYLAVSDLRQDKKAWHVSVSASNIKALDGSDCIKDARLSFSNSAVKFIIDSEQPDPDPQTGLIHTVATEFDRQDRVPEVSDVQFLVTDNQSSQIVLQANQGNLPQGEVGSQIGDVKIDLLANSGKKNTQYRADLIWMLNTVVNP